MLDCCNEPSMTEFTWVNAAHQARLPEKFADFFERHGTIRAREGCRRAYLRFYLRGQAIVDRRGGQLGVFTTDASRQGIGFLSPVQLLPKERCRIQLPKTKGFQIEVVRCRRIDERCYECGAMFVLGAIVK
jgi:hypothetical protein